MLLHRIEHCGRNAKSDRRAQSSYGLKEATSNRLLGARHRAHDVHVRDVKFEVCTDYAEREAGEEECPIRKVRF